MDLTPGEFESLITALFEAMRLPQTQSSRDGGVDRVDFLSATHLWRKILDLGETIQKPWARVPSATCMALRLGEGPRLVFHALLIRIDTVLAQQFRQACDFEPKRDDRNRRDGRV